MAERKKLTMYYPSDFDPKLVPKMKRDPNFTCEVRMMLPFNVQCNKCGEFMYMGKKFNSKKENAEGEKYKGIQIIRFYIKCGTCANMMTFKTDPERGDYSMESGGTRTFEMWQEKNAIAENNNEERRVGENEDAMTTLENRTRDTQKMVDMLDQLDELKAMSSRNQRIDADALMKAADEKRLKLEDGINQEDEELLQSIKFTSTKKTIRLNEEGSDGSISDNESSDEDNKKTTLSEIDPLKSLAKKQLELEMKNKSLNHSIPVVKKMARKLKTNDQKGNAKKPKKEVVAEETKKQESPLSGLTGLGDYGSSGDSD